MNTISLRTFHEVSQYVDFRPPMVALLAEFRRGAIADRGRVHESLAVETHLRPLVSAWDSVFPEFPECRWRRRTITWEYHRGRRDAYLKRLILATVPANADNHRLIFNPATVFGRHGRWLAKVLPDFEVIGTDIDPTWNRLFRFVSFWKYHDLTNFRFVQENIFDPDLKRSPAAVSFWGACGSLTDACMDYAIATRAPFLICRSCCHDNIGGNTQIVRRPGLLNAFFAWKNRLFLKNREKRSGYYFCDRYSKGAYPRSRAARKLMEGETILAVARNSVDSDICRSLIDLDRALYLQEHGYNVLYREELFFAHKKDVADEETTGGP